MKQTKVLIIDDEFPMRYLIEHHLKRKGYDVILAKDGPEGVKAAQLGQPDVIVLDVMMPGMNGFEVCQQLKSDSDLAQIPIVFLTASEAKEYKTRAFAVGADDYLTKPFQPDELEAHITAVLRRSQRQQSMVLQPKKGRIVSMFSPKGGVGTTTLAIQLAEAMIMHEGLPVILIDMDLPLGGVAPMLNLPTRNHILNLLNAPRDHLSVPFIRQFTQQQRAELLIIPAPGKITAFSQAAQTQNLEPILTQLVNASYQVIMDLGSQLNPLTRTAMQQSDYVFVVTSGQPVANKLHETFMNTAVDLGIEPHRLMPIVNELHGSVQDLELSRLPVAHIPHTSERSRTRLWLKEQGMRKLASILR